MGKVREIDPGTVFGRLTFVSEVPRRNNIRYALVKCECGQDRHVGIPDLLSGHTKSCGCLTGKTMAPKRYKDVRHGKELHKEYSTWRNMISRCHDTGHHAYADYGGRGISVCSRWRDDFMAFLEDVGRRPGNGYSIDKINNDGNYEPGNVRWATKKEQNRNRSDSHFVTFDGQTKTIGEWAEIKGWNLMTLWDRIVKHNWTPERALTQPLKNYPRRRARPTDKSEQNNG